MGAGNHRWSSLGEMGRKAFSVLRAVLEFLMEGKDMFFACEACGKTFIARALILGGWKIIGDDGVQKREAHMICPACGSRKFYLTNPPI